MNTELITQAKAQIEALQATLALLTKEEGYDNFPLDLTVYSGNLSELVESLNEYDIYDLNDPNEDE